MAELRLNISLSGSRNLLSDSGVGLAPVDARLAAGLPLVCVIFSLFDLLRLRKSRIKPTQVDLAADFGFLKGIAQSCTVGIIYVPTSSQKRKHCTNASSPDRDLHTYEDPIFTSKGVVR